MKAQYEKKKKQVAFKSTIINLRSATTSQWNLCSLAELHLQVEFSMELQLAGKRHRHPNTLKCQMLKILLEDITLQESKHFMKCAWILEVILLYFWFTFYSFSHRVALKVPLFTGTGGPRVTNKVL